MAITTTPSALDGLLDPHYLATAIKACRQNKSLTVDELAILANVPAELVYALEDEQTIAIEVANVLQLLEVVFPEQFHKSSLDQYSQRITRINQQQLVINSLVSQKAVYDSDFNAAAAIIVAELAKTLAAEYAGIWLFDEGKQSLFCAAAYSLSAAAAPPEAYSLKNFPDYFKHAGSKRTRVADFTKPNPVISEFCQQELTCLGASAALCTSIYLHDEPLGIVFTEHVGDKRLWHSDEVSFHGEVANIITLAYMNAESKASRLILLEKQRLYHSTIFELSRMDSIINGDIATAIPVITERVAQVLKVAVVDIWLMNPSQDTLLGLDEYHSDDQQHQRPQNYSRKKFPRLFQAIEQERVVVANDVRSDIRVNEDMALLPVMGFHRYFVWQLERRAKPWPCCLLNMWVSPKTGNQMKLPLPVRSLNKFHSW